MKEEEIRTSVEGVKKLWADWNRLENAYRDYAGSYYCPAHPNSVLKSPEDMEKLLRMKREDAIKKVFGYGGNGHVAMPQQAERFRWRLCIEFYQYMGAGIPKTVFDYIAGLCQMEFEDAVKWARLLDKHQWDTYTVSPEQIRKEERRKRIKTLGRALIVPAWILNLLYLFNFGRQIFFGTGWLFSDPMVYLALGALLAGLLTFAQALFADEGAEILIFLFCSAAGYTIIFFAMFYHQGDVFRKAFWAGCLPWTAVYALCQGIGTAAGKWLRKL